MSDELLRLYNSELQFIRRQGDDFARAHPEVASHLKIGSEGENDPYVGRLVEAFAYLNARTRLKLEDEFPEIAGSLVDVVLPHYQRPIPSMSIAQFVLDRGQAELFNGYPIPVGSSLETQPVDGEPCTFRTCYPTTCWPLEVHSIQLRGVPFEAPQAILPKPALGLLKISLRCLDGKAPLAQFKTRSLRFFIKLAAPFCYQLYELIFDGVLGVSLATSAKDPAAIQLRGNSQYTAAITPVGFAEDEGLVDYPPQSFIGYRLLSEYFAFPEKFLFFDVQLGNALAEQQGSQFDLYFYLSRRWQDLEPHIQPDTLQLGCTPIINLFPKRTEPIRLTHFAASYPVIPDARRPHAHEVYSIEEVTAISASGETRDIQPFYSFRHAEYKQNRAFWHASRREVESNNELARGTELDISFVDLDFNPLQVDNWTIDLRTWCTNRNLPGRMSAGSNGPQLQLESGGAIDQVNLVVKPTPPLRPPIGQALRWQVVSHLSLNHLSLVDDQQGATALRELLMLYDFRRDEITGNAIAGLQSVSSRPILGRVPGDTSGAMCRGVEVKLEFDESKFSSGNMFLFASVLDRFFALYCNLNSFTQTIAVSNRRQGVMHQWPARAGVQSIL